MRRDDIISRIERIAHTVAAALSLEIVEVELKGSGHNQVLRIYIDKPGGVTHADCEVFSREVSAALDVEDPIEGSYDLQVSSPGVERKLKKWQDWERFQGQKAKVVLKQPAAGDLKSFSGLISHAATDPSGAQTVTVELNDGRHVSFPYQQVDRANLKFEW